MLLVRYHDQHEVLELFRAADLCAVSSLHDGMNLVAKEFVAAPADEGGVLILSAFAGARGIVGSPYVVNPYDTKAVANAFEQALSMPVSEQRERLRQMRDMVRIRNIHHWAGQMLLDAAQNRKHRHVADMVQERGGMRNASIRAIKPSSAAVKASCVLRISLCSITPINIPSFARMDEWVQKA